MEIIPSEFCHGLWFSKHMKIKSNSVPQKVSNVHICFGVRKMLSTSKCISGIININLFGRELYGSQSQIIYVFQNGTAWLRVLCLKDIILDTMQGKKIAPNMTLIHSMCYLEWELWSLWNILMMSSMMGINSREEQSWLAFMPSWETPIALSDFPGHPETSEFSVHGPFRDTFIRLRMLLSLHLIPLFLFLSSFLDGQYIGNRSDDIHFCSPEK